MRPWLICLGLLVSLAPLLPALGQGEDPPEILTRTWEWPELKTLEIRGEIAFILKPGPTPRVTVKTTRALFDQLSVTNWWGWAGLVVESGLRGPREKGVVEVSIETPDLEALTVADRSSGTVEWPGLAGRLSVREDSAVSVLFTGGRHQLSVTWLSTVALRGRAEILEAEVRRQSSVDGRDFAAQEIDLRLDEASSYRAGETGRGTALVRHDSRFDPGAGTSWTIRQSE